MIYRPVAGVEVSVLGSDTVLLDAEGAMVRALNPTAARMWALLDGRRSEAQVVEVLASEYRVDAASIAPEVRSFLESLLALKLIEPRT